MGTAPPSPGLTAVEDDHTQHIPEHNFKPAGHATQPVSANHIDVSTIEKGDTINTHPVTGPVPDPSLDPDAKTGKEHVQLERTNPDLYRALEKEHVYLTHRDEQGNYLVRSTKDDARNPRNWSNGKRYGVVGLASWLNILV